MKPSLRKPFGIIGLILGLTIYALLVAQLSPWIGRLHVLVQLPIYLILGVAWLLPLKPWLIWMETGHWRQNDEH